MMKETKAYLPNRNCVKHAQLHPFVSFRYFTQTYYNTQMTDRPPSKCHVCTKHISSLHACISSLIMVLVRIWKMSSFAMSYVRGRDFGIIKFLQALRSSSIEE